MPQTPLLTRREFLGSLRPSWMTRRNLAHAGIALGAIAATCLVVSFVRQVSPMTILKGAGVIVCFLLGLFVLGVVVVAAQAILQRSPLIVRAVANVVMMKLIPAAGLGFAGILIYQRWLRGDDNTGVWISLAMYSVSMVSHEFKKLRGTQT